MEKHSFQQDILHTFRMEALKSMMKKKFTRIFQDHKRPADTISVLDTIKSHEADITEQY